MIDTVKPKLTLDSKTTFKPKEAFELIGIGLTKGYEYLQSGRLRSVKNGRNYIVPKSAIEDFLNTRAI